MRSKRLAWAMRFCLRRSRPFTSSNGILKPGTISARALAVAVRVAFPTASIYSADGADILVVAIAHSHRRPGYWHQRLTPLPPGEGQG